MYCILSCVRWYKSSKFFPLTGLTPLCFYRNSPVSTFLKIKPNDRLILKAVVCCLKIRRTISGKVDAVISCKVKLYLSWIRLPVTSSVRMVFQCLRYRTRVSGSSGNILVPGENAGEKTREISPFHFRFTTSGDVISGDATSGRACARDHFRHHLKCGLSCASILLPIYNVLQFQDIKY